MIKSSLEIWFERFGYFFRSMHYSHVPQISSRALCVLILFEAVEQRDF